MKPVEVSLLLHEVGKYMAEVATINSNGLVRSLKHKVKGARKPIIIIWMGTCELTRKDGASITLTDEPYDLVNRMIESCKQLRTDLLHINV